MDIKINTSQVAKLPAFMRHKRCANLIRIGGNNDGGYVVAKSDVMQADFLLSFGVNTDWKFEKDFIKLNNTCINAYDASTNSKLFLKQALGSLSRKDLKTALIVLYRLLEYKNFFKGKRKLIKKYVGTIKNNLYINIEEVFEKTNGKNIFIKMDIEGGEYRCLESLVKNQSRIIGVVIEFHAVDLHIMKIREFISSFSLPITHIHINNNDPLLLTDEPMTVEVTFSKTGKLLEDYASYPNELDQPNNSKLPEILVTFSDN